jgi:hypothetical protein
MAETDNRFLRNSGESARKLILERKSAAIESGLRPTCVPLT